jgi:hypothetical protein
MKEQALKYADYGWHVFPVEGKRPLVKWSDEATTDHDTIDGWWERWPDANIGISCGPSGLLVVDVDEPAALDRILPIIGGTDGQCVASTGGGGLHIYYRSSTPVRNSVSTLADKVDIRSAGGFVVAPPSLHSSGARYEWANRAEPSEAPAALLEALQRPKAEPPTSAPPTSGLTHERWGMAILAGESSNIETAAVGTRNHTLFISSLSVYAAVKGGHLDRAVADLRLRQAAEHVGLEPGETEDTLASAWAAAHPRHPGEQPEPVPAARPESPRTSTMRVLTIEQLASLPPPRWLLHNRIPEGQTWMYGEPGAGKTFLALDWAAAVAASGLTVVYFVGEGVQGFARRVLAIREANPHQNFSSLLVVPQAPHLMEQGSVAIMRQTVKENSPALVVVDTFARASVGADENSAKDVGMAIDVLDSLWHDYQCSSLVIHHSTKNSGTERGSSAIRGAADATWEVQAAAPGAVIGGQAVCRKMKDAEPPQPWLFQMRPSADSAVIYPSAIG